MPDVRRTVTQNMEWMDLQVGDIFQVDEINFIVIDRDGNNAVIQQYDHVKEHVFNDDNTNKYEGSDLQKYVLGEYKYAYSSLGVAPACRIHLESMESAPTGAADDVLTEIRDLLTQIAKAVS